MVAAGLYGPDEMPELAASSAFDVGATIVDLRQTPILAVGCTGEHLTSQVALPRAANIPRVLAHVPYATPAPRRPRERFAGDGVGRPVTQSSDERNFLMRTAMERWLRGQKAWEEASGYGAVEANRADAKMSD